MKDNQKSKDHIRAARDWLGDAEHSLDQDDEIRGDLKVMLAKAELSQVHEGEQTQAVKRWFRRMAPLAAAVCITAAGFAGWQSISHMSDTPATSADAGGANRPDMPKPLPPAAPAAPQTQKQAAADAPAADAAPAAPAEAAVPAATPAQEPPAERQMVQEKPSAEIPVPESASSPRVPDAQKQKLMQTAGQALRAR